MKRYVADTQSILWHLAKDRHLSRQARRIFGLVEKGRAQVLIPSIVLVEAVFLMQRRRIPEAQVSKLLELSEDAGASICVVPLNMAVAQAVSDFGPVAIPDMPDRIIAAMARALNLPLITVDPIITDSELVEVIW
ncbi:MAG: type II toxin-antitoxin system VapC family toxin [Chloroflexi bacterium]|nr:type II toxin-antitoxin system VapC family toxin [Chloroflexota bacterium]